MLDHLNWYLVELERNLRGTRNSQSVADFLAESRGHLTERRDDLVARGMDPVSATKAAIVEFGDPQSLASAFSGRLGLSQTHYRLGVGIAVGLALTVLIGFFVLILDVPNWHRGPWVSGSFWTASLAFPVLAWMIWRTRRWVALQVGGLALVGALILSLLFTTTSGMGSLGGRRFAVFLPARAEQVAVRERWLPRLDQDFAKLQAWRASDRTSPAADDLLKELAGNRLAIPVTSPWWFRYGGLIPSDFVRDFDTLSASRISFSMESAGSLDAAREAWQTYADDYAAFLIAQRRNVQAEIAALTDLKPMSFKDRWLYLGYPGLAIVAAGSLAALLMNAAVLLVAYCLGEVRSRRWRRVVG